MDKRIDVEDKTIENRLRNYHDGFMFAQKVIAKAFGLIPGKGVKNYCEVAIKISELDNSDFQFSCSFREEDWHRGGRFGRSEGEDNMFYLPITRLENSKYIIDYTTLFGQMGHEGIARLQGIARQQKLERLAHERADGADGADSLHTRAKDEAATHPLVRYAEKRINYFNKALVGYAAEELRDFIFDYVDNLLRKTHALRIPTNRFSENLI